MNDSAETQAPDFMNGGGDMGERMRRHDWSATPLGSPEGWPQPLRTLVALMLSSRQPMFIAWGGERTMLYNDGYAPMCGGRHPWALGKRFDDVWHDILDDVGPIMDRAYAGISTHMDDIEFTMYRHGYPEETHFSFSYTPVPDETGAIGGVFCACDETTEKVFAERRHRFLISLSDHLRGAADPLTVLDTAARMLGRHLGASRVGYGEPDLSGENLDVVADWSGEGISSAVGLVPISAFGGEMIAEYRAGLPWVVEDAEVDPRPSVRRAAADYVAWDSRAVIGVPLVKGERWLAVMFVHNELPRVWRPDEVELVREVAERTWSALERARAERALRESESRFKNLADHAPVIIWVTEPDGSCIYLNRRWYEYSGLTEEASLGFGWLGEVHPDDRPEVQRRFTECNEQRIGFQMEYRLRRGDGLYRWVLVVASPRHADDGRFLGYVGSVIDIEERHEAERRQTLLAREVDHRAKNALAVVLSVVRLTRAERPADFQGAVEGRVAALARAHSLLSKSRWAGGALEEIIAEELAPFSGGNEGRTCYGGPPTFLVPDAVQPVGMILHELAANAAKYGALSMPDGRVDIRWEHDGGDFLRLDWRETGFAGGYKKPSRYGFGSRMIEAAAMQLGGRAEFGWEPDGLRFVLTIASQNLRPASVPVEEFPDFAVPHAATGRLDGSRILIVEDDSLLAMATRNALEEQGCAVVGPANTLGEALRLIETTPALDAAVLDVNLRGEEVWPAVERLKARGVPYVLTTGYWRQTLLFRDAPVLEKPVALDRLAAVLERLVTAPSEEV